MVPSETTPQNLFPSDVEAEDTVAETSEVTSNPDAIAQGIKDRNTGLGSTVESASHHMASGKPTTGGDLDAMNEQAKVVGEEAIGGTTPTPAQNDVDKIAQATGINTQPEEPVEVMNEMQQRDAHRFELDPDSKGPTASS